MTQLPDLKLILDRLEAESSKLAESITEIEKLKPLTDEIELVRECVNHLKGNLTFVKSAHDETLTNLKESVSRWESIREEIKAHVRVENSDLFKKAKEALESSQRDLIKQISSQSDAKLSQLESSLEESQSLLPVELSKTEERLRENLPSKKNFNILTVLLIVLIGLSACTLVLLTTR